MKKLIRNILRESDDLDWIRDTKDPLQPGLIYQTPNGNTLKIKRQHGERIIYDVYDVIYKKYDEIGLSRHTFLEWIDDGTWVLTDKMITESDDLGWMDDVSEYITLEPNKAYFFDPKINGDELLRFIKRIDPNYTRVLNWFNDRTRDYDTIKYFVTVEDDDHGVGIVGWCSVSKLTDIERNYGSKIELVNAREVFTF